MLLYSTQLHHTVFRHSMALYSIHIYDKTAFCVSFV